MAGNKHPVFTLIPVMNIMTTLMTLFMEPEHSRKPFHTVWNYPDQQCRSMGIDFQLHQYNIESNSQDFIDDTIALYYSSQLGMWPHFLFSNGSDTAIYGGWPHRTNLSAHLGHLGDVIASHQSPSSSGFGVIDMELWRPILKTNYGRFSPYRQKLVDHIASLYPYLQTQDHRSIAEDLWLLSTKTLMTMSLTVAKLTRPNAKWGYYGYPELVTTNANDELQWLWNIVTAYYPSIYIKDFSVPMDEVKEHIKAKIAEAFRVRALYGNPDHPIMAYTSVHHIPEKNYEKWLDLALRLPIEMGADGVILWASSKNFSPDARRACNHIRRYVQNRVGPYMRRLTRFLNQCSKQLCSDKGRCVRKSYAKSIPHLVHRGNEKRGNGVELFETLLYRDVYTEFKQNYMCQCYTGWYGKRCAEATDDV